MKLKNLFVIILALLILAPFGVMESIIWCKKLVVKREIKHTLMKSISKDQLVLISVTKEEKYTKLDWEHSKEFEYNDAMFDVVYEETKDGLINYWCWPDNDESSLNKLLKSLANEKNQQDNNDIIKLYKLLSFTCHHTKMQYRIDEPTKLLFGMVNDSFISWIKSPPTPPPCQIS